MSKYCDNCKNKWHCGDNCTCDESKAYEKGRADAIEECISKINSYISHPQLISAIQVIVRDLEKLKENKKC